MKNILKALLIILTLNLLSVNVYIPQLGMKHSNDLFFGEIITLVLIVITIYRVATNKEQLSRFRKHYLKWIIILFVIMFVELGYRTMKYGFALEYIMNFRFVVSHLFIVLIFNKDMINRKVIDYIMITLFTYFAAYQLIYFLSNMQIRSSKLVGNVNIYLGLLLIMIPYIINYLIRHPKNNYVTYILYLSIFITYYLIPFSGSRSGFYSILGAIIITVLLFSKLLGKQRVIILLSTVLLGIACNISTLFITKNPQQISSVSRATTIEVNFLDEYVAKGYVEGEDPTKQVYLEGSEIIDDITGVKSDSIRNTLWTKSIENVKKEPIMGYGKLISEATLNNYPTFQRPHNFMLEYLLIFGALGTPVYMYLLLSSGIYDSVRKIKNNTFKIDSRLIQFVLQFGFIAAFSFFQPTLNTAIIVQILTLSFISLYYEEIYYD